ncbi:hypothetical protein [Victivallis vadensis]|uniref:hypothetical protein n=1 Tax=Victivallis vadensis TaxID=172901 RepID=UPI00307F5606
MTNEALLEEWNNAEPVAVPPADDIIARWEKATPIDWKPGHFIPTRRNWAAMRESFAGDPLAFVLDPKLRADFEFVTAREKDPELTRKKLALANYYANMRRERVLFAYDNLDSFIKQFHGKELSADAAYNEVAKLLTPQQSMAEGGEYWKSVGKAGGAKVAKSVTNAGWSLLKQFMIGAEMQALADPLAPKSYEAAQETMNRVGNVEKVIEKQRGESVGYYGDVAQENTAAILKDDWFTSSEGIADWCTNAFTAVLVEAPNMGAQVALSIAAPQAAPFLLGGIYANDKYFDLSDEHPEMSDSDKAINAALTGVINGALDKISVGILTGKGVKPELVKQGMAKAIRYSLASIGKEGGVEAAQQLAENSVDIMTGVYGDFHKLSWEERGKLLLKGVPESFLVGAVYGAPYAGIGYMNARQRERLRVDGQAFLEQRRAEIMAKETVTQQDLVELQECNNLLEAANPDAVIRLGAAVNFNEQLQPQAEVADPDQEMSVEELAQQAEQQYWIRTKALVHNPADTADRVRELAALYPGVNTEVVDDPAMFSDAARAEAARREIDLDNVRGFYDPATNTMVVNAARVRPSEVPALALHEIVGHAGLKQVLGNAYDQMLDGVIRDHRDDLGTIPLRYNLDLDTVKGQREAAEEYIAHIAESNPDLKPSWWREFLQQIKMLLRRVPGLENLRYTDREIEAMLARSARAMRRSGKVPPPDARANALWGRADGEAGDGQVRTGTEAEMRFAVNENGETLFGVAGRDGNLTARRIIDDRSIRPDEPVLTSDGSDVWGEITPEMAAAAPELGMEALPIKLLKGRHTGPHTGYGLAHVYKQHGAELEARGYDLAEYLIGIFSRPHQIYASSQGGNIRLELVNKSKPRDIGVLELRKEDGFYSVITAFPQDFAHYKMRGELVWRYTGSKPNKISQEGSSVISAGKQRTSPLEPLSAENAAGTARVTRPKPDSNINDSGEKSSTSDDDGIRFSIAPVWTGSAADYDRPSLHYIGTGEGAQAYGWGLYGSSDRGIATGYAERDVKNKFKQPSMKINGETFTQGNSAALTGKEEWFGVLLQHLYSVNGNRKQAAKNIRDGIRRLRNLAKSETDGKELEFYQAMISDLKRAADFLADEGNTVEYDGGRNIYKQTFWPDKEENLLDWDEPVPPEQMQQIADQAVKEQLPFGYTEDGKNFFNGSGTSGELLYKDLAKSFNLGSPKAVSEFLYRAGIDGITYIGDASGVRNYVAFSDQDIRVDEHLRFSVSPEHQAKVELMARAVLDRAETAASPEEIMELLNRRGVEIDDIELARQVWIEARETARERNRIIEQNRMRDYIRNSDPWIAVLEDVYGSEFHIKPGRKYRDEEFGANHQTGWIDNRKKAGSGIAPDEAAATLSRQFGEEITDDDVIDHFRNLRRSDFTKMRRRDSAELRRLEKEQENLANEVLLDSLREGGVLLDDTLIRNYPQAARQFAREIMPKETPPGEVDPIDWQAVKAAQQQQENDMRGYAAGYSRGRAEGEQAGRERLKQARQAFQERYRKKNDDWRKLLKQVRDDRNNIRDVQKLARAFVVNHLPMEERGKFLPQVEKLSTYSGVPTPKHPEGRRNAELEALMSRIMKAEKEYSRNRNTQAIKDMLEAVKVKRNRRGIPVSVVPEIQQTVDRIREIVNMNVPAVNNLINAHNEEIAELEKKHVQSDRLELLRNDNELLVTFGKLKEQAPEDVRAARELLYHLIRDGRDSLRSRLDARLSEVEAMREQAITEASRGTNVYGKTDADLNFAGMLPQMGLHSLLDIASGSEGADFDRTVAGRLFRKVEESTQREATANRKLQQDFEAFLKGVGVDSRIKKNAFFTMLDRKEEQTGVFRLQYFQESGNKEHPITELGRRPSIRKALSIERARKLVAEYDENGTLSPEFLQQLFKETDLAAYEIPPASIDFLRKQLADFDSGLQQEYEIFGDEADDAELNELRRRFQKGESVVLILPDPSTGYREIEQELSPGSALQVLLTWEQPHYRAGMEWNGWSEKSIEQLRAYLGRHPEVLALGSWMRDYIKQQRPELDRAARDRYGAGLPELENYWPGSFRESLTDAVAPQNGIGGRSYGTMSINPSFLIGRKFQLFDVDTNTSALSVFLTNQIESQHFIAWHETIRDLRSVFGSSKVQKTLRTHYGEKFRQQLVKSIDALANGGGDRALATQFLSNLYRYWVPAKIAVNSASVAKQMAGVISYMNDVPPSQFFKYFFGSSKRFNAEFAEWVEWAKGTDYVKNRMAGGLDKDLIYLMNYTRDSKSYNPISDAMIEYGTLPTRLADLWATLHGGYAVFKYHYDQALKRGTDERSAWNYAALRWQRATDETQQSGYQKDLNEYQRNAGAYRYLTTFLTNPIQVMNLELQTLNQLRFGADKGEARSKLARQVLVNHIMLPTLMVGITEFFRHGTEWDEYEWEDFFASWLLGPFEGAFIIGKVLAGALNLGADIAVGRSARPRALFQALPVIDEAMLSAYSLYRTLAKEKPFEADDYLKMLKNIGDIGVLGGTAAAPVGAAGTIISAFTREIRRFRRLFAGQQQ